MLVSFFNRSSRRSWQPSQLFRSHWWWNGCCNRFLGFLPQDLELEESMEESSWTTTTIELVVGSFVTMLLFLFSGLNTHTKEINSKMRGCKIMDQTWEEKGHRMSSTTTATKKTSKRSLGSSLLWTDKQRKHKQLHFILLEASLSFIHWTLFCHRNHLLKSILSSSTFIMHTIPNQLDILSLLCIWSVVTCCSLSFAPIITAMIHLHQDKYRHKKSLGYKRWECRMSYTHIYARQTKKSGVMMMMKLPLNTDHGIDMNLVQFVQSNHQWNVSHYFFSPVILSVDCLPAFVSVVIALSFLLSTKTRRKTTASLENKSRWRRTKKNKPNCLSSSNCFICLCVFSFVTSLINNPCLLLLFLLHCKRIKTATDTKTNYRYR